MNTSNDFQKKFLAFLRRFHLVIVIVVTVLVLSVAVLLLYKLIVDKASGENAVGTSSAAPNFDQETIQRIKQLKTSEEPSTPLEISGGRIDPFNE